MKPQVVQGVRAIAFGTVATRKWSPFRSPAFGRVSTIAGALRDWRGLLVVGLLVGLAVML